MKLPTEPTIPNDQDMVFWLKSQKQLVDKLKASDTNSEEKSRLLLVWLWLVNLMCVDIDKLRDTGYVSKQLAIKTSITASMATGANFLNAVTMLPFFLLSFKSIELWLF